MHTLVVIADDFTGAGDSGVTFARSGARVALVMDENGIGDAMRKSDVVAVSSETRFMSVHDAGHAVAALARRCRDAGAGTFFKKIDSAMRGNPGAETAAMLNALDIPVAVVCPAMPSSGRVVIGGRLLLDGQPLHATSLGRDPFTPASDADLAESMAAGSGMKTGRLDLEDIAKGPRWLNERNEKLIADGCRIIVADAASESDLAALCALLKAGAGRLLPAGSSGLARACAGPSAKNSPAPRGRLLAVVGSLDEKALEQAGYAESQGAFSPVPVDVEAGLADPEAETARVASAVLKENGRPILLRGAKFPERDRLSHDNASRVAELYGAIAARLCRDNAFDAVFATGGSTAVAVARSLGLKTLALEGEILPGVVLSSRAFHEPGESGNGPGVCQFVSKAGSFGARDTLAVIAGAFCEGSSL